MKKLLLLALICTMILGVTGCTNKNVDASNEPNGFDSGEIEEIVDETNENEVIETEPEVSVTPEETDETEETPEVEKIVFPIESQETLEAIIAQMYDATGLEFPRFVNTPLSTDNQIYMLGSDKFEFVLGVASEPMMTSQAHSLVLFTVPEGSDVEAIKEDIKANVDSYKWICVGVDEENVIVDNYNNLIVLIMDNQSKALHDVFLAMTK